MLLSELLKGINASWNLSEDIRISGIAYNSQKVEKGFVFVCIRGYATDGHRYIADALSRGAAAVVVEDGAAEVSGAVKIVTADTRKALAMMGANWYQHPAREIKVIGVTGTNGKTTVTTLIKQILEFDGHKVGLVGTNGNMIGDKLLPSERTTPESLELQELFRSMADAGCDYAVMEVSSHSLALSRVYGIPFEMGAFTNLTQDHLDFHKTMENYLKAKKMLFPMCKAAAVNIDDAAGREIAQEKTCNMVTYSIDGASDCRAETVRISAKGVLFDLDFKGTKYPARLAIPGRFSVYNALAACAVGLSLGVEPEKVLGALMVAKGVKGRAETVYTNTDYTVIIDYAHTPDGLENIVSTVREFAEGRVITVFGCGGDRDATKRPIMGEIAGRLSDYCIITSDNPRTEEPMSIILQIEEGMKRTSCRYEMIENRRAAIRAAMDMARKGDCIILAGKGHETYQIIGREKRHFDEREVIQEILEGRNEA